MADLVWPDVHVMFGVFFYNQPALFRYDHQERLTAIEAMEHPYFAPIRASSSGGAKA